MLATLLLTVIITILYIINIVRYKVNYKEIIILFLMIILLGLNHSNPDSEIYENNFLSNYYLNLDILFGVLNYIAKTIGISWPQLRFIYYYFCILLLMVSIHKITKQVGLFYLLYILSNFFIDAVQVRNFIGSILVLYAFTFIIKKKSGTIITGLLILLIAALIQRTHFIWFIFLIGFLILKKFKVLILPYILGSFLIAILITILITIPTIFNMLINLLSFIPIKALQDYLTSRNPDASVGFIFFCWIPSIINLILIWYCRKRLFINKNSISFSTRNYIDLVYYINIVAVICFPLYYINTNFYRVGRNILFLNLIIYAIYFKNIYHHKINLEIFAFIGIVLITFIYYFYATYIYNSEYIYTVVFNTFTNNYLLDFLF